MPLETRLFVAITETRTRMRAGQPAAVAAAACAFIYDTSFEQVHALAVIAERECTAVRAQLAIEQERRKRELRAAGIVPHE